MRTPALAVAVIFLVGCGGGGSSSSTTPILAASGFTNASLNGGYAFEAIGTSGSQAEAGSGVVVADGNGNITSGEITLNVGGVVSCHGIFSGSYAVNANGTGTGAVTLTPDAASQVKGCGTAFVDHFSLAIGNAGATRILAEQDSGGTLVANAVKQ